MVKKTGLVFAALTLVIAIAFAVSGAFALENQASSQSHQMAPPNAPEPNESAALALPSWAPLVKRVMPTVVNVAVVQTVKSAGFSLGGPEEGPDDNGRRPGRIPVILLGPGPTVLLGSSSDRHRASSSSTV